MITEFTFREKLQEESYSHVLLPSNSTVRDFMLSNRFSAPPLRIAEEKEKF